MTRLINRISCTLFFILCGLSCYSQTVDSLQLMKDLQELSSDSYGGRKPNTYGGRLAQYYISTRFKEIGLEGYTSDYKIGFPIRTGKIDSSLPDSVSSNYNKILGVNMVGYVKGLDSTVLVISAHYDHVGVVDNKIFNGADDNASGTSALFALAAYFAKNPPKHTLVFTAFDAEEMLMKGSLAFIKYPPVYLKDILLNINMDMLGTSTGNEIHVAGTRFSPQFKSLVQKAFLNNQKLRVVFDYDNPDDPENRIFRSDHAAFYLTGIPFLYFGVPEHENYHQPTDDYKNIHHGFYYRVVNLILRSILEIDGNLSQKNN